jgi:EAL domain-containing protein (putative c-di-GMP-specific phosphodiesterase class I)
MDEAVRTRVTLGAELRSAVARGQLFLLYQPQVAIGTGRIIGLEALVRWQHPERGTLGPDLFIPVAERTGIIVALGRWALHTACRQARSWLDAGMAPVRVAVNVSGLQFKAPLELEADVTTALAEARLPPQLLEIELTESTLMDVTPEHSDALGRLRDSGVTLAIDDFGTGYSSLGYLGLFPVDRIKIAREFVKDIATEPGQVAVAKATIGLARDLGIAVIAEGVETREQLEVLKSLGCAEVQGYYFSKPLDAEDVTLALRSGGILAHHGVSVTSANGAY